MKDFLGLGLLSVLDAKENQASELAKVGWGSCASSGPLMAPGKARPLERNQLAFFGRTVLGSLGSMGPSLPL
jgi:hypothetical protein